MLADYMTQEGGYRPFSRHGLKSCASPFQENGWNSKLRIADTDLKFFFRPFIWISLLQKMSYETTCGVMVDCIVYGEKDDLTSPSSRIATGQIFKGGTGYFDLQQQILFWFIQNDSLINL